MVDLTTRLIKTLRKYSCRKESIHHQKKKQITYFRKLAFKTFNGCKVLDNKHSRWRGGALNSTEAYKD